jgi:hypothetical protein
MQQGKHMARQVVWWSLPSDRSAAIGEDPQQRFALVLLHLLHPPPPPHGPVTRTRPVQGPWRPLDEASWSKGSIGQYAGGLGEGDEGLSKTLGFQGAEANGGTEHYGDRGNGDMGR